MVTHQLFLCDYCPAYRSKYTVQRSNRKWMTNKNKRTRPSNNINQKVVIDVSKKIDTFKCIINIFINHLSFIHPVPHLFAQIKIARCPTFQVIYYLFQSEFIILPYIQSLLSCRYYANKQSPKMNKSRAIWFIMISFFNLAKQILIWQTQFKFKPKSVLQIARKTHENEKIKAFWQTTLV